MRRALLAGITILLLTPSAATASAPIAWQRKALTLSEHVWRQPPGTFTLTFAVPPGDDAEFNAAGWAPLGAHQIFINTDRTWDGYPEFCQVELHEAGHAIGLAHRPSGIMRAETFITVAKEIRHGHVIMHWYGVDHRCLPGYVIR